MKYLFFKQFRKEIKLGNSQLVYSIPLLMCILTGCGPNTSKKHDFLSKDSTMVDSVTKEVRCWKTKNSGLAYLITKEDTMESSNFIQGKDFLLYDFFKNRDGVKSKLYVLRENTFEYNEKIAFKDNNSIDTLNTEFLDFFSTVDTCYITFVGGDYEEGNVFFFQNNDSYGITPQTVTDTFSSNSLVVKIPLSQLKAVPDKGVYMARKKSKIKLEGKEVEGIESRNFYFSLKNIRVRDKQKSLFAH